MLSIDDNGKVYVIPEALEYREVKDIPLESLPEVIKYVYHAYKLPHPFDIYGPNERKQKVCATYFIDKEPKDFEGQFYVKALIKRYLDECLTKTEVFLMSIRGDMDELIDHMRNIPLFKDGKIDTVVQVSADVDGKIISRDAHVFATVKVDNTEEKFKVLKRLDDLLTMMEKMEANVIQQRKEKKTERKRIFDT